MRKGFFKVFDPETSAQRMKIPTSFIDYMNGKLTRKVSLRDGFGNMWPIGVTKIGCDFYFHYGWTKFTKDNTLEFGDFLIFDYGKNGEFDLKLLAINGCEKKGDGGEKKREERNMEHQIKIEPKMKNLSRDSSSGSSSDDSDEDYVEEEVEEEEENEMEPRSKHIYKEKEEEDEEEEDEDENERVGTLMNKTPRSKARCKRATYHKVSGRHDQFGKDIFRSGRAIQPENPYFIAKVRVKRKDELYVPVDVVRDYKLEIPSSMIIRDSAGREFQTKLKIWGDGRIWLVGGWRSLCNWNLVDKNDICICEFVREKCSKGLYLQVQVLYEGSSSHPNKKYKK
ncbi:B3 domain-containing protein [Capsicum galapagoense]